MCPQATAEDDTAIGRVPAVRPSMPWLVTEVTCLPGYRLFVRFEDGLAGTVDMAGLIASTEAGVFANLRDPAVFEQARLEYGAVTWPGELDLAPDAMHEEIRQNGEWKLT